MFVQLQAEATELLEGLGLGQVQAEEGEQVKRGLQSHCQEIY